jgi:hypothetical protein
MDKDLIDSYRRAEYRVDGLAEPIKIGRINPAVERLLEQERAVSWCFITAWNPFSVELSGEENRKRNKKLESDLSNYVILEGEGSDPDGDWTPERSFLVLGIPREDALSLAGKYRQAAIVFGESGKPAELLSNTAP